MQYFVQASVVRIEAHADSFTSCSNRHELQCDQQFVTRLMSQRSPSSSHAVTTQSGKDAQLAGPGTEDCVLLHYRLTAECAVVHTSTLSAVPPECLTLQPLWHRVATILPSPTSW